MPKTLLKMRTLVTILCAAWAAGCAYGLHPHTTLAGQYFPSSLAAELREGQTPEEVRAILGEPFEIQQEAEGTVWRYYERANPRACTTYLFGLSLGSRPESVSEVLVTFVPIV